jgi:hypothetical protein
MTDLLIELEGGKYTICRSASGEMVALRYGEPWRDLTGDKLVGALVDELTGFLEEKKQ